MSLLGIDLLRLCMDSNFESLTFIAAQPEESQSILIYNHTIILY